MRHPPNLSADPLNPRKLRESHTKGGGPLSACSRQLTDTCRSAAEGDIPKRVRELNEAAQRALARLETVAWNVRGSLTLLMSG